MIIILDTRMKTIKMINDHKYCGYCAHSVETSVLNGYTILPILSREYKYENKFLKPFNA